MGYNKFAIIIWHCGQISEIM